MVEGCECKFLRPAGAGIVYRVEFRGCYSRLISIQPFGLGFKNLEGLFNRQSPMDNFLARRLRRVRIGPLTETDLELRFVGHFALAGKLPVAPAVSMKME